VIPPLSPPAERRRPSVQEQMHEGETEKAFASLTNQQQEPELKGDSTMGTPKQIVVFDPEFAPTPEIVRKMERAGYIVVVANPDHVRVLLVQHVGSGDPIALAALRTIQGQDDAATCRKFAREVCGALLAGTIAPKP
jgi:hypothetical protein